MSFGKLSRSFVLMVQTHYLSVGVEYDGHTLLIEASKFCEITNLSLCKNVRERYCIFAMGVCV